MTEINDEEYPFITVSTRAESGRPWMTLWLTEKTYCYPLGLGAGERLGEWVDEECGVRFLSLAYVASLGEQRVPWREGLKAFADFRHWKNYSTIVPEWVRQQIDEVYRDQD